MTAIAGHAISAAPTAVAFAGTPLTPEAPGRRINGMLVSLNTVGQSVVNSETIALKNNTARSGGLIMGGIGAGGPFGGNSPLPTQRNLSNGTGAKQAAVTEVAMRVRRFDVELAEPSWLPKWEEGNDPLTKVSFDDLIETQGIASTLPTAGAATNALLDQACQKCFEGLPNVVYLGASGESLSKLVDEEPLGEHPLL
ncbi:MAG: hypothetical protein Q9161_008325 [Pseudevernia consocians]